MPDFKLPTVPPEQVLTKIQADQLARRLEAVAQMIRDLQEKSSVPPEIRRSSIFQAVLEIALDMEVALVANLMLRS